MQANHTQPAGAGFVAAGAILGGLGVALGAFGAHGLEGILEPGRLEVFDTAVRYHVTHSLALILTGILMGAWQGPWPARAGWAFLTGVTVFSGSLYLLAATDVGLLGAITPLGGASFLIGWGCLAAAAFRTRRLLQTGG